MKRFTAFLAVLVLLVTMLMPVGGMAESTTATVKGGWLRLRAGASFDAQTIASYYTGTVVRIHSQSGKWCYVTTPDGRKGYMYGDYLEIGGAPVGAAYVTSRNGKGVRLRSGPGVGYSVIGLYAVGTRLTILSRGNYWHYVRIGSQTGYMMAEFIFDGSTPRPDPDPGYTAWVTSTNGRAVNLRAGAGKNYAVIGSYRVGTQVTVISHGAVWDYIRVGTRTGYMMNEFLTTTQGTTVVTGVALSSNAPYVGQTLTASVQPFGAQVSYRWLNENGVILSTNASYLVTARDVGHQIRVQVTGVSGTVGSATSPYTLPVTAIPTPEDTPAPEKQTLNGTVSIPTAVKVGVTIYPVVNVNASNLSYQWYQNGVLVGTSATFTPTDAMAGGQLRLIVVADGFAGEVASGYCIVQANVATSTDL